MPSSKVILEFFVVLVCTALISYYLGREEGQRVNKRQLDKTTIERDIFIKGYKSLLATNETLEAILDKGDE